MRSLPLALALLFPTVGVAQSIHAAGEFEAVPALISQVLTKTKAPGLAVAVSRHGRVIWEQGFGWADKEARTPATAHTLFGLASITKSFTGTELAILASRGRINLDRPLNRYLGASPIYSPEWNADEATVRRIATHTGGLTSFDAICYANEPGCDRSLPDAIRRYGIVFWKPGTRFDYSNLGYGALSQAIAEVRGISYPQALREDLLAPLGIAECAPDRSDRVAPHYADGARAPDQVALALGASGMACSADALLRFGMFELGESVGGGKPPLSRAGIATTQTETVATGEEPLRYGLGWWINQAQHGYRVVYGSGGTLDSGALLYLIPSEDIAIAVLGNAGSPQLSDLADAIAGVLLPKYAADLRRSEPAAATAAPASAARDPRLAAFAGTWRGSIGTWKGAVPVVFEIAADGTTQASIGGAPLKPERKARLYGDGGIVLGAHGEIGTPETARRRPYRIGLELYPDTSGALRGAATTWQDEGARNGGVFSHWVRVSRDLGLNQP